MHCCNPFNNCGYCPCCGRPNRYYTWPQPQIYVQQPHVIYQQPQIVYVVPAKGSAEAATQRLAGMVA